jgi:hypothetical protein
MPICAVKKNLRTSRPMSAFALARARIGATRFANSRRILGFRKAATRAQSGSARPRFTPRTAPLRSIFRAPRSRRRAATALRRRRRRRSEAELRLEEIVHRLRVRLAFGRLHHLADEPSEHGGLCLRLLRLVAATMLSTTFSITDLSVTCLMPSASTIAGGSPPGFDQTMGPLTRFRRIGVCRRSLASPFQVRSATGQHRRHGGVKGGGKGWGQGL